MKTTGHFFALSTLTISLVLMLFACHRNEGPPGRPCDNIAAQVSLVTQGVNIIPEIVGGAPPYRYEWSNGSTEPFLHSPASGQYSLTVIDDNGCRSFATAEFENPCDDSDLSARVVAGIGTAEVVISGGQAPYSISWSNGSSETSIENVPPGLYNVSVSDAVPCAVELDTEIKTGCEGVVSVADMDGNVYAVVEIGGQCWMAENLRTTTYRNGMPVMEENFQSSWGPSTVGIYTVYNPDSLEVSPFGNVYNWIAASDTRGLCPQGWSVPTRLQWSVLSAFAGGDEVAGLSLMATTGWEAALPGAQDSYGFAALPGGYLDVFSGFSQVGTHAVFWSQTAFPTGINVYARSLNGLTFSFDDIFLPRNRGLCVRCIKD